MILVALYDSWQRIEALHVSKKNFKKLEDIEAYIQRGTLEGLTCICGSTMSSSLFKFPGFATTSTHPPT